MLIFISAVLFGVGFLLNATGTGVPAAISPFSLLLLGLTCLALHQAGVGTAWNISRGRGRRR
jgi:hypothetical protein